VFKNKKIDVSKTDTLVGEGTTFEGKIVSQASIRIEGRVIGDILCDGDLTIGEKAVVESNVKARNITIAGEVQGDVVAMNKLSITASGKLFGNIESSAFTIEAGGIFTGTSHMTVGDAIPASDKHHTPDSTAPEAKAL